MTERYDNRGVHIEGDNLGAAAAGDRAQAIYHSGGDGADARIIEALAELRRLVELHPAQVSEPDLVRRDIGRIEEEVREARPDRRALSDTLDRLLRRAADGGNVFLAVQKLGELLGGLA